MKGQEGPKSAMRGEDHNDMYTDVRYMDYRRDELPVEKAVALTGELTYSEAWNAVAEGAVTVRGSTATPGLLVKSTDTLYLRDQVLPKRQDIVFYLLNKPRNVMSTCKVGSNATRSELKRAEEGGTVLDFVPPSPRVVPAGRLDFESEGLLVLTNDGSLCKLLTSPQFAVSKTYAVLIQTFPHGKHSSLPLPQRLELLVNSGATLQSGVTLHCQAARLLRPAGDARFWVEVELGEGRNREVRKMMKSVGCSVLRLVRTRIGPLAGPLSQELEIAPELVISPVPELEAVPRHELEGSGSQPQKLELETGEGFEGDEEPEARASSSKRVPVTARPGEGHNDASDASHGHGTSLSPGSDATVRMVTRGRGLLEPGMVTCLTAEEVDALFALARAPGPPEPESDSSSAATATAAS